MSTNPFVGLASIASATKTAANAARTVSNYAHGGADADTALALKSDSLIDYTKSTQVRPTVLVDSEVLYSEHLDAIMQSLMSSFAGYYLMAVNMSNVVTDVKVMKTLNKLQPDRSVTDAIVGLGMGALRAATEAYRYRLPHYRGGIKTRYTVAQESAEPVTRMAMESVAHTDAAHDSKMKDATTVAKEISSLSVGKLLNVGIVNNAGSVVQVPVEVRMMAYPIPSRVLVDCLDNSGQKTSFSQRWFDWRTGAIDFVNDMILCNDLVDSHRRKLMADKDGLYSQILDKQRSNRVAGFLTANPGVANASNMVVMSDATLKEVELKANCNFKSYRDRQELFSHTALMIIAVLDKQWDTVTFYHRGIEEASTIPVKSLVAHVQKGGSDINEILKAYTRGSSPTY